MDTETIKYSVNFPFLIFQHQAANDTHHHHDDEFEYEYYDWYDYYEDHDQDEDYGDPTAETKQTSQFRALLGMVAR